MADEADKVKAIPDNAGRSRTAEADYFGMSSGSLVGSYFHGAHQQQGRVVARLGDSRYLLEFYDWVMGEPMFQQIMDIDEMIDDWYYYDTPEWMRFHHDNSLKHIWARRASK